MNGFELRNGQWWCDQVAVDALAFYQPGAFGEAGGQIDSTAPVRGHELTTRVELLRDEPDHPHAARPDRLEPGELP